MSFDRMLGDSIVLVSTDGTRSAPLKASVQGDTIYVMDAKAVIEEGGKILRALPSGKEESFSVLQSNFHNDPTGRMSHFQVKVRKDTSLLPSSRNTTINISNSHGFQIGDGNSQLFIQSVTALTDAIGAANVPEAEKHEAKSKLKDFLKHPLVTSILGAAAKTMLDKL